jgi:hypothetical protein
MRALVAGPCVSELGWELMEWQGYVRHRARGIPRARVVVSTTRGLEGLYADFCEHFVSHDLICDRDGHRPRGGKIHNHDEHARVIDALKSYEEQWKVGGCDVTWLHSWGKQAAKINSKTPQTWCRYGILNKDSPYKLIVHARDRKTHASFTGDNYPQTAWDRLIERLCLSGIIKLHEIAAIGSTDAALLPEGVMDIRDQPISVVIDLIASSYMVIGPSSGPMHLASLCGIPHVVWATNKFQSLIGGGNKARYECDWNPLRTPVEVILHKKGHIVPASHIAAIVTKLLHSVYKKDRF